MELRQGDSECRMNQKVIVSEENGRAHIATNPDGQYNVRHYRLDGKLVKHETCCDYLLLNDSLQNAYYIELKGHDISRAVEQVLAGERLCRALLKNYVSYYRIVASKSPTLDNMPKKYRNLLDKVGTKRLICKTRRLEEILG